MLQREAAIAAASYSTLGAVAGSLCLSGHVKRLTASYARVSLATQRVEYSAAFFSESPESVYLSASAHPHHRACSNALRDEECRGNEKEEEDEKKPSGQL